MTDNIEKEGIRRAIDRFQKEHPCHLTFDVTLFNHDTDFGVMQRAIDMVAKKCQEDADIHIICEMAKLYLEGVRPMVMPKQEWIPITFRPMDEEEYEEYRKEFGEIPIEHRKMFSCHMPEDDQEILICTSWGGVSQDRCELDEYGYALETQGDWDGVIAWMPLPEPYREEAMT